MPAATGPSRLGCGLVRQPAAGVLEDHHVAALRLAAEPRASACRPAPGRRSGWSAPSSRRGSRRPARRRSSAPARSAVRPGRSAAARAPASGGAVTRAVRRRPRAAPICAAGSAARAPRRPLAVRPSCGRTPLPLVPMTTGPPCRRTAAKPAGRSRWVQWPTGKTTQSARPITLPSGTKPPPGSPRWSRESLRVAAVVAHHPELPGRHHDVEAAPWRARRRGRGSPTRRAARR